MEVIYDLHWSPEFPNGSVTTVGEFDGVHRGHRVVLLEVLRTAVVEGCPSIVVTFDRNLATGDAGEVRAELTDMTQKLEMFESLGVDAVIVLPAERAMRSAGAGDRDDAVDWIVDEVLTARLKARAVVVGEDYNFGARRQLTVDTLRERSGAATFRIIQIPVDSRKTSLGEVISARAIRESLALGDVRSAARMLGRPFEIRSIVSTGERRGRTVGFPTANLPTPPTVQVPADGVYACWYQRSDGTRFKAAVNIGKRPTFHDYVDKSLIEAHLLNFSGDLYREPARLQFVERLRSEVKFEGIEAFQRQLERDVAAVGSLLQA